MLKDGISAVWFSRIEDYQALSCSIESCKRVLGDQCDYFVSVDDEEPVFLDIDKVSFSTSTFDQNKETGGVNRIKGQLDFFEKVYNDSGNRYILKIDSDTLCVNNAFSNWLSPNYDMFGHKAVYNKHPYPYGGAYIIDCLGFDFGSKNHLEEIDACKDKLLSSKKWSEDFTMSHLASSLLLTNDKDPFKWMSFFDYEKDLRAIIFAVDHGANLKKLCNDSSFLNCGYGFPDLKIRDSLLQLLMLN